MIVRALLLLAPTLLCSAPVSAQVDYDGEHPWGQRVDAGPDAEVGGWWYNLGTTGLRVQLLPEAPKELDVRYVFPGSAAERKVRVGDRILGVAGAPFAVAHQDGYGEEVFGAAGPIGEFAEALHAAQTEGGRLALTVRRGGSEREVELRVGEPGGFAATFPVDCARSERIRGRLLDELLETQRDDGSWGSVIQNTFAPLALLSSDEKDHRTAALRCVEFHARTTDAGDASGGLVNWRYMAAGIVLAEAHLQTGEEELLDELREVRDFILRTQYMDRSQIVPESYESHPGSQPTDDVGATGGWGHNPGFEGYGPFAMLTAQGALTLALMERCGIEVPRERLDAAYAFLQRGTGSNGYLWYADQVAGDEAWADTGRTGASALAHFLSPRADSDDRAFGRRQTTMIGEHPESYPDTHGSPMMGMGFVAAAAAFDASAFRSLMDANRWWFTLAECADGTFCYQPNRDNAGYGPDNRVLSSSVVAFVFSIPLRNLAVTGRP